MGILSGTGAHIKIRRIRAGAQFKIHDQSWSYDYLRGSSGQSRRHGGGWSA